MAVLDGKYEILTQRPLPDGQTLFAATAPDGRGLTIIWFDLESPQQELRFERYRQLLRELRKAGRAAIHDIVSRPGAHYVAWYAPGNQAAAAADAGLREVFGKYGYLPDHADLRQGSGGEAVVHALAFGEARLPLAPEPSPLPAARERRPPPVWARLSWLPDWAVSMGIATLLVLSAGALFAVSLGRTANDRLLSLPDLTGQPVNAVSDALYTLGLAVEPQPLAADLPPMSVLALEPAPGSLLRPGQRVRVRYAVAPGQAAAAEVPQLRGLAFPAEVQARLDAAQLRLGEPAYIHANVPVGAAIAQTPPAPGVAPAGSEVRVLVSLGPLAQQTFLPDLSGLAYEEALEWARLAGVAVANPEYVSDPRFAAGTVVSQTPPPYTPFPAREVALRLAVSGGPQRGGAAAVTPSLVGLPLEEAERLARAAGLSVEVGYIESASESLNLPEGVLSQTPPPGAGLGESVALLVNLHPRAVPRPAVTAELRPPEPRELAYVFFVETGISRQVARVTATTLSGHIYSVVPGVTVAGGQRLEGSWETSEPGPVTFTLYLGSEVYQQQTRND